MKSARTEFGGYTEEIFEPDDPPAAGKGNGHDHDPWPMLDRAAYHGLAGEVVAALSPHSESDPIALLVQYQVSFGNAVGRRPHYRVEATRHYTNLFAVLVGQSAKSRKGTSAEHIRHIFEIADPDWANWRTLAGMSSGEGVIWAVRDPIYSMKKGIEELTDPGVEDKRLLLDEREFFQALTVLKREGNILSRIVRDAWDNRHCLATLTKHSPARATGALISIIAHITADELRQTLDHTSMANGYANRFLFASVRRSQLLPHGSCTDDQRTERLGQATRKALDAARDQDQVEMDTDAYRFWTDIYPSLSADRPGLLGAITARAEAQTIRLALLYALLDQSPQITRAHLEAALALWRYCDASARHIFGDTVGDPIADAILRALQNVHPVGMSRTDIIAHLFNGNLVVSKINNAFARLLTDKKVRFEMQQPALGRSRQMWFAVA